MGDGGMFELAMVGKERMVGVPLFLETKTAPSGRSPRSPARPSGWSLIFIPIDPVRWMAILVDSMAEEVRRLEDHLQVVEPLAARNLALDADAARAELTPKGARLAQRCLASDRGSDAALRRLEALQNPSRRGPGRGPKQAETSAAAPAQGFSRLSTSRTWPLPGLLANSVGRGLPVSPMQTL
jgi:hypothetical protein